MWGFDGVAGRVVSVRVAREAASYLVREIISPTGELLARRDWEEKSPHMVVALPVDGRYLVSLSSVSRESVPYELAVRVLRATTPLEWDRPVAGFFRGDGPSIGIWEFDGSAGRAANVRAVLRFQVSIAARVAVRRGSRELMVVVHGIDAVVQLLSTTGEELGWAFSPGLADEARLEARLPVTGRYLVRVLARSLRRRRFAARNGSPAHDLSHVSGRLRRSAGRGGFSVVGEQMTKFGPRGPHGPPETAMRIDLSPL